MEYINLIYEVIGTCFGWFVSIYTADQDLLQFWMALVMINLIIILFLRPFFQGFSGGAGSDFVDGKKRRSKREDS